VDGPVARPTGGECGFGSQLGSLSDLVSFGVAPALALYLSTLQAVPVAGIAASLAFVLCGAWRLARFQTSAGSRRRFAGLPIPPAGVIASALAMLTLPPGAALGLVTGMSLLMVSRLPCPTLTEVKRLARSPARRAQVGVAQAPRR
jgi:CDP-diacylglycerol--serine O-phosphatidyltransferase